MRSTVDQIESGIVAKVPDIEHQLGELGFPFYMLEPQYRMRIGAACGIMSETLRQKFTGEGLAADVRIRELPEPLDDRHVLTTVADADGTIIVDGSYSQLLEVYGPEWLDTLIGRKVRFPDERALVFRDGQQDAVAEWATQVCVMTNPRIDTAAAYEFYRSMWNLEAYEPWTASAVTLKDFDGWLAGPTSGGAKFVSRLPSARMWARPLTWTSLSLAKLPPTNQPPFPSGAAAMSWPLSIFGNPGCGAPLWPSIAPARAVVGASEVNSPPT